MIFISPISSELRVSLLSIKQSSANPSKDSISFRDDLLLSYYQGGTSENEFIFHAGTKIEDSKIISNGGRVLNCVVKSSSFKKSRESVLNLIKKINWENGFYRKDIGFKVID